MITLQVWNSEIVENCCIEEGSQWRWKQGLIGVVRDRQYWMKVRLVFEGKRTRDTEKEPELWWEQCVE